MTPVAPTIHAFDPLLAGKVGLSIDAPASGTTKIDWYASLTSTGAHSIHLATTYPTSGTADALSVIIDAGSTLYCVANVTDSTGSSVFSGQVEADVSAGPPPPPTMTQLQHLNAALGATYSVGAIIELPPTSTVRKTVNADQTIT